MELFYCKQELEANVINFVKNELKRVKTFLSHDYSESPCSDEEDEEGQGDARDGAWKIAVHVLRNMGQVIPAQQLEQCKLHISLNTDLFHLYFVIVTC